MIIKSNSFVETSFHFQSMKVDSRVFWLHPGAIFTPTSSHFLMLHHFYCSAHPNILFLYQQGANGCTCISPILSTSLLSSVWLYRADKGHLMKLILIKCTTALLYEDHRLLIFSMLKTQLKREIRADLITFFSSSSSF